MGVAFIFLGFEKSCKQITVARPIIIKIDFNFMDFNRSTNFFYSVRHVNKIVFYCIYMINLVFNSYKIMFLRIIIYFYSIGFWGVYLGLAN